MIKTQNSKFTMKISVFIIVDSLKSPKFNYSNASNQFQVNLQIY